MRAALEKPHLRIPGGLKHISVGSKSVFGVNCDDNIYTMTNISFDAKEHFLIGDSNSAFDWFSYANLIGRKL